MKVEAKIQPTHQESEDQIGISQEPQTLLEKGFNGVLRSSFTKVTERPESGEQKHLFTIHNLKNEESPVHSEVQSDHFI